MKAGRFHAKTCKPCGAVFRFESGRHNRQASLSFISLLLLIERKIKADREKQDTNRDRR